MDIKSSCSKIHLQYSNDYKYFVWSNTLIYFSYGVPRLYGRGVNGDLASDKTNKFDKVMFIISCGDKGGISSSDTEYWDNGQDMSPVFSHIKQYREMRSLVLSGSHQDSKHIGRHCSHFVLSYKALCFDVPVRGKINRHS